jgi:hypothetical protein
MTEAEIRADERAKVLEGMKIQADEYVAKWGPILGWDAAKADAWNIRVAAQRVCGGASNG